MESSVKREKYEPKFGRVLIKREVKEKIGSIIIADAKRHASCRGKIIALGETAGWTEAYTESGEQAPVQTLKIGDEVIFGRHSGAWLDSTYSNGHDNDDGSLFICQDADILCVIKGE
jgi:co-chaperonin GroES (HSP10)